MMRCEETLVLVVRRQLALMQRAHVRQAGFLPARPTPRLESRWALHSRSLSDLFDFFPLD